MSENDEVKWVILKTNRGEETRKKDKGKLKTGKDRKRHRRQKENDRVTDSKEQTKSDLVRPESQHIQPWGGQADQERGHQAESNTYLLPCTEDERTTGWVLWVRTWFYPFSLGSTPPTPPSAGLALHWPQRYLRPLLEIKPNVVPSCLPPSPSTGSPLSIFFPFSLWSSKMSLLGFGIRPSLYG